MDESYSPRERIRKKKDFSNLYKKGNSARGTYLNLIYLPNSLTYSRMAVVASKKIGNAVQRNRVRRRVKELFRRNKDLLMTPVDMIVVTKKGIQDATLDDIRPQFLSMIRAIGSNKPRP
jgi:ribonuclease P protein component